MFDRVERLIGKENLNRIKNTNILLVGIGGVGGMCLETLVRNGIENITLIDFDTIDISNLNRQVITFNDNIDEKKVNEATKFCNRINPNCNIKTYDLFLDETNIEELLESNKFDYVIDACDSIKTKKLIITNCIKRKIKFISCMGTGNKIDPSKLEITDIRNTANDPLARIIRKFVKDLKIKSKVMVVSSIEVPIKKDKDILSMSMVPNTAGILLASYIINTIIEIKK
ncbi:MAG: ThiF family adenylyltransferase [bacterium]|nr:ThiF family adenylyltransferase [bacterium]